MTEKLTPSDVLGHEIHDQRGGYEDGQRLPAAGSPGHQKSYDIRAGIAEADPGAGPEQGAGGSVEEELFGPDGDDPGQSGGERVQTRQKLRQDQIPRPMREERLLGAPDDGVRVEGEPAHGPEDLGPQ